MKPGIFKVTPACQAVTEILSRVGDKWTVLVVSYLGNEPMRFNELRRTVTGISQKMLTTTLRSLERDGFVLRTVYLGVPAKVEYQLTDLGRDLLIPVRNLGAWAIANEAKVKKARLQYDAAQKGKCCTTIE